jgi:hypothetical protein
MDIIGRSTDDGKPCIVRVLGEGTFPESEVTMTPKVIGRRLFTDGVTHPVYEDERGQFIVVDGERFDGVWIVPEEYQADTPVIVGWEVHRGGQGKRLGVNGWVTPRLPSLEPENLTGCHGQV